MIPTGKNVDKLLSTLLYIALIGLVAWGGARTINYTLESRFYKDFLMKWDVAIMSHSAKKGMWPHFSGSNHVEYMDNLVSMMSRNGVTPPKSNTKRSYVYRLKKIGPPAEDVFLLCFPDKITLYGISADTFIRIDTFIDGKHNENAGRFTGRSGKKGKTFIGLLRL